MALTGAIPPAKSYPIDPKTVGEHIKRMRMDRGLFQSHIGVT